MPVFEMPERFTNLQEKMGIPISPYDTMPIAVGGMAGLGAKLGWNFLKKAIPLTIIGYGAYNVLSGDKKSNITPEQAKAIAQQAFNDEHRVALAQREQAMAMNQFLGKVSKLIAENADKLTPKQLQTIIDLTFTLAKPHMNIYAKTAFMSPLDIAKAQQMQAKAIRDIMGASLLTQDKSSLYGGLQALPIFGYNQYANLYDIGD